MAVAGSTRANPASNHNPAATRNNHQYNHQNSNQNQEDGPVFNADGSIVVAAEDISYKDIENESWLESALPLFFKQTGYMPGSVPYFSNSQSFEATPEMKKINTLMAYYCSYNISAVLAGNKSKSPVTGKPVYKVTKSVTEIRTLYNDRHINEAIDKHWPVIKAPIAIKKAFHSCFDKLRKADSNKGGQAKRPTPDEDIRRVTAKKAAASGENPGPATVQAVPDTPNERNAEILHIIETYKKRIAAHKKPISVGFVLPPELSTSK
jgi:hypothetical protein